MTLNRAQFNHLWLHANLLASLSLALLAAEIDAMPVLDLPVVDDEAREREALAGLKALEAEWLRTAEAVPADEPAPGDSAQTLNQGAGVGVGPITLSAEAVAAMLDLPAALSRAYAALPGLAAGLDPAWAEADRPVLIAALATLDEAEALSQEAGAPPLTPLTAPLTASALALWLARHHTVDPALDALVCELTQLPGPTLPD